MHARQKSIRIYFLSIVALAAAALACQINIGGPETPEATVPVSTEAVDSLGDLWDTAITGAEESGQVTLVVNESQLTSLLALRLQEEEEPFLRDPQVFLRDGQVQIYGTANQGNLVASVRIILTVEVDPDGAPRLILESADFGPWPIPEGLLTGLSAMVDEAFTGNFGPAATGFRLESIAISGGLMALTGRIR
jgi:hypothetical protein